MQLYVYVLTAILLPFAHGYVANSPYPTFAHCDQTLISAIKANWLIMGKPRNTLQTLEDNGLYTLFQTTYDYLNSNNKCIYLKVNNNIVNVTFVPKEGNNVASLIYSVEQGDDGVFKGKPVENDAPEFRLNWYIIYSGNAVVVYYVCSELEGSREFPMTSVGISNKHANLFTSPFVTALSKLLKGWGLIPKYNYGLECILNE